MDQHTRDLLFARRLAATGNARILREGAGLSRAEEARAVGVAEITIRSWERGDRRPTGSRGARFGAFLRELMTFSAEQAG